MQNRVFKLLESIYLTMLGILIGAVITVGAIVAPVVFNATDFITLNMGKFESGLLMSEIFQRFNIILLIVTILIVVVEARNYLRFNRDKIVLLSSFFVVTSSFLFLFYYTPYIIEAQQVGVSVIETKAFDGMHKGSEIDFKLLLVSSVILFIRKIYIKK